MIFFSVASLFRFVIRVTLAMQCCSGEQGLHGAGWGWKERRGESAGVLDDCSESLGGGAR